MGESRGALKETFPHLWRYFENKWGLKSCKKIPEEGFYLLLQKQCFPYEWFTDFSKFQETQLPDKAAFYSGLKEEDIDEETYQHAKKVWSTFRLETFKDFHDLYLELDTVSLFK